MQIRVSYAYLYGRRYLEAAMIRVRKVKERGKKKTRSQMSVKLTRVEKSWYELLFSFTSIIINLIVSLKASSIVSLVFRLLPGRYSQGQG
jgi:hypothetical protein